MKQFKEIWDLIFNWLGNGKKVIIGIGFLVIGFVWNMTSQSIHTLEQVPFIIMVTGGLCLVNVLFFVLIFVCIMELGIYLMAGETSDFTNLIMIWGACFLFGWALNYALLETVQLEGIAKKIVMAFFETLAGAAMIVAVFTVSIWLAI